MLHSLVYVDFSMGINNIDLSNINLDDDNFDDNDLKTIIHVKSVPWCNKHEQSMKF